MPGAVLRERCGTGQDIAALESSSVLGAGGYFWWVFAVGLL